MAQLLFVSAAIGEGNLLAVSMFASGEPAFFHILAGSRLVENITVTIAIHPLSSLSGFVLTPLEIVLTPATCCNRTASNRVQLSPIMDATVSGAAAKRSTLFLSTSLLTPSSPFVSVRSSVEVTVYSPGSISVPTVIGVAEGASTSFYVTRSGGDTSADVFVTPSLVYAANSSTVDVLLVSPASFHLNASVNSVVVQVSFIDNAFQTRPYHASSWLGHIQFAVSSSASSVTIAPVDVFVVENDRAALDVSPKRMTVSEGGAFVVDVTINVALVEALPIELSFADGTSQVAALFAASASSPQTVRVNIVTMDDNIAQMDREMLLICSTNASNEFMVLSALHATVLVTVTDNDVPDFITSDAGSVVALSEGSGSIQLTVTIAVQPTVNVMMNITAPSIIDVHPRSFVFSAFSTQSFTVTLSAVDDAYARGSLFSSIQLMSTALQPEWSTSRSIAVSVADNDEVGVIVTTSSDDWSALTEGSPTTHVVSVSLASAPFQATATDNDVLLSAAVEITVTSPLGHCANPATGKLAWSSRFRTTLLMKVHGLRGWMVY
jgi:hypothetical protein